MELAALIASIDGRDEAEAERLVAGLLAHFWPGGCGDHHRPGAAEWLRRGGLPEPGGGALDGSPN